MEALGRQGSCARGSPRNSLQGLSTPRDDSPTPPTDPAGALGATEPPCSALVGAESSYGFRSLAVSQECPRYDGTWQLLIIVGA